MSAANIFLLILGATTIVYGFTASRFYPGAFGVGDRTRTIPKWVGRSWFALIGFLFTYAGLTGSFPLLLMRIISIGVGCEIIVSGLFFKQVQPSSQPPVLSATPDTKPLGRFSFLIVGLFFIVAGLALRR